MMSVRELIGLGMRSYEVDYLLYLGIKERNREHWQQAACNACGDAA